MSLILCIAIKCLFRRGGARGALSGGTHRRARKLSEVLRDVGWSYNNNAANRGSNKVTEPSAALTSTYSCSCFATSCLIFLTPFLVLRHLDSLRLPLLLRNIFVL